MMQVIIINCDQLFSCPLSYIRPFISLSGGDDDVGYSTFRSSISPRKTAIRETPMGRITSYSSRVYTSSPILGAIEGQASVNPADIVAHRQKEKEDLHVSSSIFRFLFSNRVKWRFLMDWTQWWTIFCRFINFRKLPVQRFLYSSAMYVHCSLLVTRLHVTVLPLSSLWIRSSKLSVDIQSWIVWNSFITRPWISRVAAVFSEQCA